MPKQEHVSKTMVMRELERKSVPYQVHVHRHNQVTAEGVALDLGVPLAQVIKAMVVQCSDRRFVLVLVPGDRRLNLKKVGVAVNDKNVVLASGRDVERVTGFRVGSVSVVGLRRKDVASYVDQGVLALEQMIISAGRPDVGLALTPQALLQALDGARVGDYCEEG
jgi:Cys-tRNA(Pro)/Cys-tRNA(Cys) deacylase